MTGLSDLQVLGVALVSCGIGTICGWVACWRWIFGRWNRYLGSRDER